MENFVQHILFDRKVEGTSLLSQTTLSVKVQAGGLQKSGQRCACVNFEDQTQTPENNNSLIFIHTVLCCYVVLSSKSIKKIPCTTPDGKEVKSDNSLHVIESKLTKCRSLLFAFLIIIFYWLIDWLIDWLVFDFTDLLFIFIFHFSGGGGEGG